MSISASLISTTIIFPSLSRNPKPTAIPSHHFSSNGVGFMVECSSRPQKKATKHHMKTRPKKTQPWDVNRKPTVYAPLPKLPSEWTLIERGEPVAVAVKEEEEEDDDDEFPPRFLFEDLDDEEVV